MSPLVLATRNPGKVAELRQILGGEVIGLDEFPEVGEIAETGLTFEENALLKAHAVAAATGLTAVADDSGLCVDALNGMPGVFSARWAGTHGDDEANMRLLLGQLSGVTLRTAHFACAAAAVFPSGEREIAEARMDGSLLTEPRGSGGFGYDPIFVPAGDSRTTAELTPDEKNKISHRGKAFRALAARLNTP